MSDHWPTHAGDVDDAAHWSSHAGAAGAPALYPGHSHEQPPAPPVRATDAVAGNPGYFEPPGSQIPADLNDLISTQPYVNPSPMTVWATGEHVVLGDASSAYWDGTWRQGAAP